MPSAKCLKKPELMALQVWLCSYIFAASGCRLSIIMADEGNYCAECTESKGETEDGGCARVSSDFKPLSPFLGPAYISEYKLETHFRFGHSHLSSLSSLQARASSPLHKSSCNLQPCPTRSSRPPRMSSPRPRTLTRLLTSR